MDRVIDSNLKIDEAFNRCPGRETIEEEFSRIHGLKIVDMKDLPYWQNDRDTVVVEIRSDDPTKTALELGKFASDYAVDEFDFQRGDLMYVARLWWD